MTGLIHLRARDLHPGLWRFLSPDAVQPNAPGSQGYNLYAYVANNPTTWIDPTGHVLTSPLSLACAGAPVGSAARELRPDFLQRGLADGYHLEAVSRAIAAVDLLLAGTAQAQFGDRLAARSASEDPSNRHGTRYGDQQRVCVYDFAIALVGMVSGVAWEG